MWFLTMPTTRSRSALASLSRRQIASAISAPTYSCLKKLYSPGAPSRGWRARGLPTSCRSAPSRPIGSPSRLVHHRQRVAEDVVLVKPVLRAADALEQLRDHLAEQARLAHQLEAARRPRRRQHLEQLVANPLGGDLAKHVQRRRDGGLRRRIDVELQLGRLPHGAHRAQAVLAEPRQRIAHRADQPPRRSPCPSNGSVSRSPSGS